MTLVQILSLIVLGGVSCRMAALPRPTHFRLSCFDWATWVVAHALIAAGALLGLLQRDGAEQPAIAGLALYFALRWVRRAKRRPT